MVRTDAYVAATIIDPETIGIGKKNIKAVPYLIILSGTEQGKRFLLDKQINTFGRGSEVDIMISDLKTSRLHGAFIIGDEKILLEDYHSTNGVYVDGNRVTKCEVDPKSRIRIGNTTIRIDFKNSVEAEFEDNLVAAATTDPLTGLLNRRSFAKFALDEIAFCIEHDCFTTIAVCDADYFKKINDRFGHPTGDFVLKHLARTIQGNFNDGDLLARYGGEEFIVLLRRSGPDICQNACKKLISAVSSHEILFEGHSITTTISVGMCSRKGAAIGSLDEMIKRADEALYLAKNNGRNRFESTP